MKKNIKINSQTYPGVEKVILKDTENNDVAFSETSDATAVSSDIKSGKTAYVLGEKVTGSHVCPSAPSATLVEKSITQNGVYSASDDTADGFSKVTVEIPQTGITPEGSLNISENGTFDVTNYASAIVNVLSSGGVSDVKSGTLSMTSGQSLSFEHGFSAAPKALLLLTADEISYNQHIGLVATNLISTAGEIAAASQVHSTLFIQKNSSTGVVSIGTRVYTAVVFGDTEITLDNTGDYKLAGSFKWYAFA